MYQITDYTYKQAKKHGYAVKPSTNKGKKIDVYKKEQKIASVGALGMYDYPTYLNLEKQGKVPEGTAKKRRELYKKRHAKDLHAGAGRLANLLLW